MRAIETTIAESLPAAEAAVRAALGEEGFGVLTEIDVAATLKAKLGVDRPPLKILGACNPVLANEALSVDPSVSLVLPCNVVLEAVAGGTRVAAADPRDLLTPRTCASWLTTRQPGSGAPSARSARRQTPDRSLPIRRTARRSPRTTAQTGIRR